MYQQIDKCADIAESIRLRLQNELDQDKSSAERNAMGQFATPSSLAHDILDKAKLFLADAQSVRFLDPAIGTGAFYSALKQVFPTNRVLDARGYEADQHYGTPAKELWHDSGLDLRIDDFTKVPVPNATARFDLVICNPPYVRHHHLQNGEKYWLRARANAEVGIEPSGLAGLYCYFMLLSHRWMSHDALAGWLIPSEFMDVNYGTALKSYLLDHVTLLQIHRFDPADVQFGDALVSSAVVWFRNDKPPSNHSVKMSFGGSLMDPRVEREVSTSELRDCRKWTQFPNKAPKKHQNVATLGNFFQIKRGLVTGDNKFFVLSGEEITRRELPWQVFRPILPSPRDLDVDEILGDESGNPLLSKRFFLLDCRLPIEQIQHEFPTLWSYLEEGRERGVADRYLCQHRKPWYSQESRPPAPFVCTYLGRASSKNRKPFRFISNRSQATVANVYLMLYPTDAVKLALAKDETLHARTWEALKSIGTDELLGEGRVYGGGLHKLEPRELANVQLEELNELFPNVTQSPIQGDLFT